MGCGVYWSQISELTRALNVMGRFGIPADALPFQQLSALRGQLLTRVGLKFPRATSLLAKLAGLSPGVVKLWHDVESGWLAEGRPTPGSPPIYRYVDDATAMAILKGELTHELEEYLFTPDDYIGE